LTHPFDTSAGVDDDVLSAAFELLTTGPAEVKRVRAGRLAYYEQILADELCFADSLVMESLPSKRRQIVHDESISLLKLMCSDAGSDAGSERWYSMHEFELSHDHPVLSDTPAFLPSYHSAIFFL
jgi:hypothetical protein